MKIFFKFCTLILLFSLFISCSGETVKPSEGFDGISFSGASYVYDGLEHSLKINGVLPEGYKVTYVNNGQTDVGSIIAKAEIRDPSGTIKAIFEAKITVTPASYNMGTVSFSNKSFIYDKQPHSIFIDGVLPEGVTVSYENNEHTEIGEYKVTANFIGDDNHYPIESMTAYMYISSRQYDFSGVTFSDKVFDYDGNEHTIVVDGNIPEGVTVRYIDNSLTEPSVKTAKAIFIDDLGEIVFALEAKIIVSDYSTTLQNLRFEDLTVEYDGQEHVLQLSGQIPEGLTVSVRNNRLTIPGVSKATAEIYDSSGKLVYQKEATLSVLKGHFDTSTVVFSDKTVEYDGTYHTLYAENIPVGVNVSYSRNSLNCEGALLVTASFDSQYYDITGGQRTATLRVIPYDYSPTKDSNPISIKATADRIVINYKTTRYGSDVSIVRLNAWEYRPDDENDGWEKYTKHVEGTIVANANNSSQQYIDRYTEDGFDGIYCKYYFVKDGKTVSGPYFVSDIDCEPDHDTIVLPASKKGLCVSTNTVPTASTIKAKSVSMNVIINNLILLSDNGNAIPFECNGRTYYFDGKAVAEIDGITHRYYGEGIVPSVCLILYIDPASLLTKDVVKKMAYPDVSDAASTYAVNTAMSESAELWIATIEFLAERYSRENGQFGHISQLVIGNEIDKAYQWNSMCNFGSEEIDLATYVQEYERTLRLANNAVKKYSSKMKVFSSFTYFWNPSSSTSLIGAYAPREIVETLNETTKRQGDFDWGICFHPYSVNWGNSYDVVWTDTESINNGNINITGSYDDTKFITFVNLEVMDQFVHRDDILCNGRVRNVIINESGVTCNNSEQEPYQALSIAWAYYKVCALDSFVSFNYGYAIDSEAVHNQGIIYRDYTLKESCYLLEILDSRDSLEETKQYLPYASYYDIRTGIRKTNIQSFQDYMDVTYSGFDFISRWSEYKIIADGI